MIANHFHSYTHTLAEVADLPGARWDSAMGGYRVNCPLTPSKRGAKNLLITPDKHRKGNLWATDFSDNCPFTSAEHLAELGLPNPPPYQPGDSAPHNDAIRGYPYGAGYQPRPVRDYRFYGWGAAPATSATAPLADATSAATSEFPGNVAPDGAMPHGLLLAPVTPTEGLRYLADKENQAEPYGVIEYAHYDGRRAKHVRRRLPNGRKDAKTWGNRGGGWYVRLWQPDPAAYLATLAAAAGVPVIFVAEGEKDAAILQSLGHWAVSTPGGAGRVNSLLFNPLLDKARELGAVVILAQDNDLAGYDWGDNLGRILGNHGVDVYRPSPSALPHGDSLADYPAEVGAIAIGARNRYRLPAEIAEGLDTALLGPVDLSEVGYLPPHTSAKVTIPEPIRPAELPCLNPGRRIVSTALRPKFAGAMGLIADVDRLLPCGKCANCYRWAALRKGYKWDYVASQLPGQQSAIDFDPMGKTEVDYVLKRVRRLIEGLWAHVAIVPVALPIEVDNDGVILPTQYRYRTLLWLLQPLRKRYKDAILRMIERGRAKAAKQGNPWAIDAPSFSDGLTITAEDFAEVLPTRTILWLGGKARRTSGFWDWGIRYPGSDEKPDTFAEGNDGKVSFDGAINPDTAEVYDVYIRDRERKYLPVGVSEVEIRDGLLAAVGDSDEERRRNPGKARLLNATVWLARVGVITRSNWDKAVGDYQAGMRPWLPGYRGPAKLIVGAIRLYLGQPIKRENLAAYLLVLAKLDNPNGGSLAEVAAAPQAEVAAAEVATQPDPAYPTAVNLGTQSTEVAPLAAAEVATGRKGKGKRAPSKLYAKLRGGIAPARPTRATATATDTQIAEVAEVAEVAPAVECTEAGLGLLAALLPAYEGAATAPAVDLAEVAERAAIALECRAYAEWLAPSTDSDKRTLGSRFSNLAARLTGATAPQAEVAAAEVASPTPSTEVGNGGGDARDTQPDPDYPSYPTEVAEVPDLVDVDGIAVDFAEVDVALLDTSDTQFAEVPGRYGVSEPDYDYAPDWDSLAAAEVD